MFCLVFFSSQSLSGLWVTDFPVGLHSAQDVQGEECSWGSLGP